MDKFEAYLEAQIEAANSEIQQFRNAKEYDAAENFVYARRALEQALEAYRKHKAEQDAPVFRVGQRVRENLLGYVGTVIEASKTGSYLVKWDGVGIPKTEFEPYLDIIEESEEAS